MKNMSNMKGVLEVSEKIHFDPLNYQNNTNYMISVPQFWYKNLFLLCFNHWLGEDRGLLDSGGKERRISLTPIYTTKTIEVCVK
jgi:hypothetical protein